MKPSVGKLTQKYTWNRCFNLHQKYESLCPPFPLEFPRKGTWWDYRY